MDAATLAQKNILHAFNVCALQNRAIMTRSFTVSLILNIANEISDDDELSLRMEALYLQERFHAVLDEQIALRSEYIELFGQDF